MPDMENATKGGRVSGLRWIKTCRTPKMHHIGHVDVPTVLLDGKNTQSDRREVNRTVLSG